MGRYHRTRPARLAEKLLKIRTVLGLSQNEMLRHLGLDEEMTRGRISGYELGTREPSLPTLLRYARSAGLCVDDLIDDELELPRRIPGSPKHTGRKRSR
jgi:transcriptional regulator with XRE-family HTH domain